MFVHPLNRKSMICRFKGSQELLLATEILICSANYARAIILLFAYHKKMMRVRKDCNYISGCFILKHMTVLLSIG